MRSGVLRQAWIVVLVLCAALPTAADRATPLLLNAPLCGATSGSATPATDTLRVGTFNVLHGLEETPSYPTHSTLDVRLEVQADEIVAEQLDLIGMQEVLLAEGAVGHADGLVVERLAAELTERTGEAWHWCWHLSNPHFPIEPDIYPGGGGPLSDAIASQASSNYGSFKEGSAVLSRYPILAAEGRRLPHRLPIEYVACPIPDVPDCNLTAIFDHRIALWARVDTPGGATDIVTTHLVHGITQFSDASAYVQAGVILALSDEMALHHGEPARRVITCDCNATTTDSPPVIGLITSAGWTDTYADRHPDSSCAPGQDPSGCTSYQDILSPVSTATSRIDYVFARAGTCDLTITASEKFADSAYPQPGGWFLWPSDHQAVRTNLDVGSCAVGVSPV